MCKMLPLLSYLLKAVFIASLTINGKDTLVQSKSSLLEMSVVDEQLFCMNMFTIPAITAAVANTMIR